MTPFFENTVKHLPHFRGALNSEQKRMINKILDRCQDFRFNRQNVAYCLATPYWETGGRMTPVREGFASTDEEAIRVVTRLKELGKIKINYAIPDPETGHSYFGRGLVQITWKDNYKRLGDALNIDLVNNPNLALDENISIDILLLGMKRGLFTGVSLDDVSEPASSSPNFENDRTIINGRDRAREIAKYANIFYEALEGWDPLAKSRTIQAADTTEGTSNKGILAAAGGAVASAVGPLLPDNASVNDVVSIGNTLKTIAPIIGPICMLLVIIGFWYIKKNQKKIKKARRSDNEQHNV